MYRREINKYIKHNCATSWTYLRDYTGMQAQQNIKFGTWDLFTGRTEIYSVEFLLTWVSGGYRGV